MECRRARLSAADGKQRDASCGQACQFEQQITLFVRTAEVVLINFEPILHNPHLFSDKHSLFNIAMPTANREIAATLVRARGSGWLQCDVYVHMNARAAAFDHPHFFAVVTDELGRFEIKGIPPGSYTLIAWHPGLTSSFSARPVYDEPHASSGNRRDFSKSLWSNLGLSFPSARSKSNGNCRWRRVMNCRPNNHATAVAELWETWS